MSIDYEELGQLYPAHVETIKARHDRALEKAGGSHAVIFSGAPRLVFLDDYHYPFKANPHFIGWLPLTSTPYCYRHPDRATRLACSECGRPICVDCSQDSAVGQKCPECAKPIGRSRVIQARNIRQVDRSTTPVTWALIAINAAIFLISELDGPTGQEIFVNAAQYKPLIDDGEFWRVFTAMFLQPIIRKSRDHFLGVIRPRIIRITIQKAGFAFIWIIDAI